MKTSNKFTTVRIVFAPVFFIIYFLPVWLNSPAKSPLSIASVCILIPLLAFAEFTDFLDGFYARKNNEVSDFGKMYDPFADVILHLTTFASFAISGYMPLIFLILIIYREFGMNFVRMVAAKKGTAIAARSGGKLKTVFYVVSGFYALLVETFVRTGLDSAWSLNMPLLHTIGKCLFGICILLAYISFADYLKTFGSVLKEGSR